MKIPKTRKPGHPKTRIFAEFEPKIGRSAIWGVRVYATF
jgi:hypothetical protein